VVFKVAQKLNIRRYVSDFRANISGATAIEYGLLVMMIGMFVLSIASLGDAVFDSLWDMIAVGFS